MHYTRLPLSGSHAGVSACRHASYFRHAEAFHAVERAIHSSREEVAIRGGCQRSDMRATTPEIVASHLQPRQHAQLSELRFTFSAYEVSMSSLSSSGDTLLCAQAAARMPAKHA